MVRHDCFLPIARNVAVITLAEMCEPRLTGWSRQKTFKHFLGAGLAADWLIGAAQRLRGDIRAAEKTTLIDGDEEPVVRFTPNMGAARAGTPDGGDDVWVAKGAHWPVSCGLVLQNAKGNPDGKRQCGNERMKLTIAINVELSRENKPG